jgi:protein-S-isoprenylcysteine O-methyltransferase Ste14|tara:strand:+ start:412 stop:888 length:477 start_codon:yes stop_codon:yes gene_type:complete
MSKTNSNVAKTWFFPPYLVAGSLILSFILENFIYSTMLSQGSVTQFTIGLIIIITSVALFYYTFILFKSNAENPHPRSVTTQLFLGGPYKYSRNPIYLAFVLILFGCGICFNSIWYIIFAILELFLLHYGIVLPEEKYLEKEFDKVYLEYKNSVRRWI